MQKAERKLKKKRKKEEKSKKKSKKSKKSKKAKKAAKSKKESKKKRKKKQKKVSSSSSSSSSSDDSSSDEAEDGEEVWIEKNADGEFKKPDAIRSTKVKKSIDKDGDGGGGGGDDELVGPSVRNTSGLSHKDFGHALLPGEGAAMVRRRFLFGRFTFYKPKSLLMHQFVCFFTGGLYR